MPYYAYEAQNEFGASSAGTLEAANPAALRDLLAASGYRLTAVRPQAVPVTPDSPTSISGAAPGSTTTVSSYAPPPVGAPASGAAPYPAGAPTAGSPGVAAGPAARQRSAQHCLSLRSHAILFREFASAFRAGMTAFQACDMILSRIPSGPIFRMLTSVRSLVMGGAGLADAIAVSPVTLDPVSVAIIRLGERGGMLPYVLDELAGSFELQLSMQNTVRPMQIIYLFIGLPLLILMWPVATIVDGSMNAVNHGASTSMAGLSAGLAAYQVAFWHQCVPMLIVLIAAWLLIQHLGRTPAGQRFADIASLRVPVWGGIQRSVSLGRFTRLLGHLYKGGNPLREAWELSAAAVPNTFLRERLLQQEPIIATGQPVSVALGASNLFGASEVSMVATGEQTGELDRALLQIAQYEEGTIARNKGLLRMGVSVLFMLIFAPVVILVVSHGMKGYMAAILKIGDT